MDNTQQASTSNSQPAQLPAQPMQPAQQSMQAGESPSSPAKHSRKKLYIGIGIIILVILILGAILIPRIYNPNAHVSMKDTIMNNIAPPQTKTDSALPPGNSDTQLNQDLQSIDTSLSSADASIGNVDQGLNDQQTNLTE